MHRLVEGEANLGLEVPASLLARSLLAPAPEEGGEDVTDIRGEAAAGDAAGTSATGEAAAGEPAEARPPESYSLRFFGSERAS